MESKAKEPLPYYSSIGSESALTKASQGGATIASLIQSGWKSAVSKWGREQLLAHHVVCSEPASALPLLRPLFGNPGAEHACIAELLRGPASIDALKHDSEPQIVLRHQPDSLGYVWAALLPFLRSTGRLDSSSTDGLSTPRPPRDRRPAHRYDDTSYDHDSSPDSGKQRPETANSDSSFSSTGFMDKPPAAPLEDASIRLASCFVRCVLNYGQPVSSSEPFLEFRDQRFAYSHDLGNSREVRAVDDGGIQVLDKETGAHHQVALLEGKRTLSRIVDGKAVIVDELLAQMLGEALALALQTHEEGQRQGVSQTDFVTILITTHYIKFFHFHIPLAYIESYKNLSLDGDEPSARPHGILRVNSTEWLDIKKPQHRKIIASHLLALVTWAHQELASSGSE